MIYVVLHCFTVNNWEVKFIEQLSRIKAAGLYDIAQQVYVFITDPSGILEDRVKEILLTYPGTKLDYSTVNYGEGFKALCKVDEIGKSTEDSKILYLHTKGVFNKYKNFKTLEIDELKAKGIDTWVEMLEYFLIDKWEECVNRLDDYDNVGVSCNSNWWWGNFWWTTSKHLKNNIPFKTYYKGSRWRSESWLHEGNANIDGIKKYEMYHIHYDPLYSYFPKYFYDGTDLSSLEFNIIEAKLGYFEQQRDEGQPIPTNREISVDVTEEIKQILNNYSKDRLILFPIEDTCKYDPAPGLSSCLRITFNTNLDKTKCIISSFMNTQLRFGNILHNKNTHI